MSDTQVFFNPLDPEVRANPYPHYAALRAADPVHRSPFGLVVLTRYDDCARVLRETRFSADMNANANVDGIGLFGNQEEAESEARDEGFNESLLNLDPPKHTRVRGLAARAFTPKAIDAWRPRVVEMVDEILDSIAADGGCDLVSTLAFPLPFQVISELLGMPTDEREQLRAWSQAITLTLEPLITAEERQAATEATDHMREFVEVVIAERRKAPRENDLLSALIAAEEEGERLSTNELVAMVLLLFVAGHETTVNLIGNGTRLLLERPDVLARFRADASLDATAVDELLRMDGPVQFTARAVLERIDFGGEVVEKGEVVMPVLGAANHDPAHFDDPDTLRIDRANAASHLALGSGIHFCLGASLARLEAQVAIGRFLRRFPTIEYAGEPEWAPRDLAARHGKAAVEGLMKPPPFLYEAPQSLAEAVAALAEHGEDAKVLAGGQSLIPLLSMRLARPSALIDLNGVIELASIELNGATTIGSMTRHRAIERSADVTRLVPLLAAAVPHIGHAAIRTRGTIGGSLAHADPAAELPAVALALDATFRAVSVRGTREIAAVDFFDGYFTTALAPDEVLTSIVFPNAEPGTGVSLQEMARRHGDFAMVAAAVSVAPSGDVRIALINVSDRPVRAIDAEAAMRSGASIEEVAAVAVRDLDPPSDLHATPAYRRKVAAVLVRRALTEASARARSAA